MTMGRKTRERFPSQFIGIIEILLYRYIMWQSLKKGLILFPDYDYGEEDEGTFPFQIINIIAIILHILAEFEKKA
jgi:hypothetical protein